MSWTGALVLACLVTLASADQGSHGGVGATTLVTAEAPAARLAVASSGGDVLGIRIARIENRQMVPFGIVVALPEGNEIGRVSIFPPDRTGDYMLSLQSEERARLARLGVVEVRLDLAAPAPGLAVELAILPTPPAHGP